MKQFIIAILMLLNGTLLFAQDANSLVYHGNKLYNEKNYKEAEVDYRKAVQKKAQNLEGNFNLGDALYKQKRFGDATKDFTGIATTANNSFVKAGAYHNLGNSFLQTKKYDESIDAYKKSLLNNPKDDATRYNLAYAQEMLKKQQQQNKQNQKNNQNNNQQNKDKNKSGQDKKNQDKNNQDKNNQNQNQQNKDQQDQKNQQSQDQPDKISKDDAQRMLDALNTQEQGTQDKLKNKKLKGTKMRVLKDW